MFTTENKIRGGLAQYFGKYRGIVTNVDDPLKQGRIRAVVPKLLGGFECNWALPCIPYLGNFAAPRPNDGVWIEFEEGNPEKPIWSGTWWTANNTPAGMPYDTSTVIYSARNDVLVIVGGRTTATLEKNTTIVCKENISTEGKEILLTGTNRLTARSSGDTSINGNNITIGAGLQVQIQAGASVTVSAGSIQLGGAAPVARLGDMVEVDVPTIGRCTGTIISGSGRVTSG